MSYGSAQGVAEFASTWTDNGYFLDPDAYQPGTNPSLETVERWLEQYSNLMDLTLGGQGFENPVTDPRALSVIDMKVNKAVADLVALSHEKGRLFADRFQASGQDGSAILEREFMAWVIARINDFESWGIPRIIDQVRGSAFSVPATRQL